LRSDEQTIVLHRAAPAKPELGQPCNGCGVCCAAETCPAARILFLQASGPCPALQWHDKKARYVCGLVMAADEQLRWLPRSLRDPAGRFFARVVAAGRGCDSDIREV
jgi:hypothetical protein